LCIRDILTARRLVSNCGAHGIFGLAAIWVGGHLGLMAF